MPSHWHIQLTEEEADMLETLRDLGAENGIDTPPKMIARDLACLERLAVNGLIEYRLDEVTVTERGLKWLRDELALLMEAA